LAHDESAPDESAIKNFAESPQNTLYLSLFDHVFHPGINRGDDRQSTSSASKLQI